MKRRVVFAVGMAWIGLAAAPLASSAEPAKNFDELLERVDKAREARSQLDAERERQFIANRDDRRRLLDEAIRARDAAKARSEQLSAQFDGNELRLAQLEDQLKIRLGSLGELFGVVHQIAGDVYTVLYNSLVSAELPGRDQFFADLSTAKELPTADVLERIAVEMLREAAETGRTSRFQATVALPNGSQASREVVRVGPFVATTGGDYLTYGPASKLLVELPRQPGGEINDLADGFARATEPYQAIPLDPSRGVLLQLYVQRPNLVERIQHGEAVGYVIIAVGVIGAVMAVYQFLYLIRVRRAVRQQLANPEELSTSNPLGRVLGAYRGDLQHIEEDAEVVELRVSEAVLREVPLLERFQSFIRLAVAAGPLLGLIGTVVGMIITFQSITESGSSDPRLMATGIGQAMIATVLGLGIAIPLLFANAGLVSLSRDIVQVLDEQSTGLIAELLERRKADRRRGATADA